MQVYTANINNGEKPKAEGLKLKRTRCPNLGVLKLFSCAFCFRPLREELGEL